MGGVEERAGRQEHLSKGGFTSGRRSIADNLMARLEEALSPFLSRESLAAPHGASSK